MTQNWYAIYTRPRWEKKVAELLSKRNIENYCPLNKVVKQWSDRKKTVMEPLFTSYVFVRVTPKELLAVRELDQVISVVHWLGKPAVIKDVEIETIRDFLKEYQNVKLEQVQVNVSDMVRILNGPLSDYEGQVVAVQSRSVKVILPSLGYAMTAEVEVTNVEVIRKKKSEPPLQLSRRVSSDN
ncbi:UpxY family transcription antiterminator [Paraflavisolibacter sp. H34]|uniref:UpxY family transcription antiterminator n=1 Tax=Huijunlia imazamoxiresistens TaxID=3127457 RepID=UPI003018E89B